MAIAEFSIIQTAVESCENVGENLENSEPTKLVP